MSWPAFGTTRTWIPSLASRSVSGSGSPLAEQIRPRDAEGIEPLSHRRLGSLDQPHGTPVEPERRTYLECGDPCQRKVAHQPFEKCPVPCCFELTFRLFGDPRAHHSAAWVQVSFRDDEARDEVGAKSGQRDGDRTTHAVAEHGAVCQGEVIEKLRDAVRMVFKRVAELFGSVARAVTKRSIRSER
jgi:hypothetical protein